MTTPRRYSRKIQFQGASSIFESLWTLSVPGWTDATFLVLSPNYARAQRWFYRPTSRARLLPSCSSSSSGVWRGLLRLPAASVCRANKGELLYDYQETGECFLRISGPRYNLLLNNDAAEPPTATVTQNQNQNGGLPVSE